MRTSTVLTAALASTVAATGFGGGFSQFGGFRGANPFTSPGNIDNECTDKQSGGFDFDGHPDGAVDKFDGFNFRGFTCKSGFGRGRRYEPRTFGRKVIGGTCHHEKEKSPSFGCDAGSGIDKFSLGSIHVRPEFDCDLEFHYDMPDGSTCKHRSPCSKSGTTVKNHQCGGAKNVTIVYPKQPKPKPSCSIDVPSISFSCGPTSTKPPKTRPTKPHHTKTKEIPETTSTPEDETTSYPAETIPTTSQPGETVPTEPAQTYPGSQPAETTSASEPVETVPYSTQPAETVPTQPAESYPGSPPGETTSASEPVETVPYSTQPAETIPTQPAESYPGTQPAETVPTQPAESYPGTQPAETVPTQPAESYPGSQPEETVPATSEYPETEAPSSTYAVETTSSAPSGPIETLPCPVVVPSCLNTFMFSVGCADNSDTDCYCPDSIFVKNVFDCIYAHGESAEVVTEAVIFFQGLCANHMPSNPAIATGATVTSYVTVTDAPIIPGPTYTTVSVVTTTVVPCTDEAGEEIPSSSSTVVISTAITVPQVGFTTGSDDNVGVVPVTTYPAAVEYPTGSVPADVPAVPTTSFAPVGTGGFTPVPTKSGLVTVSSAGRVGAGFGFALAVMGLVAAL